VCTLLNVVVGMDASGLQAAIDQLLPEERERVPEAERVKVSAAFDSLVLKGTVSDSEALVRVTDLANAYLRGGETNGNSGAAAANPRLVNMLTVGAPQQVMLEVKVAEVSKNLLDQFGIDFSRAYVPGDGSMVRFLSGILGGGPAFLGQISRTGPNGVPYSSVDAVVGGQVAGIGGAVGGNVILTPQGYVTQYGTVPGRGVTNGVLNMQKNDGLVKVLAEPSVMAISGQTGSFLAGGKIFIPVAQSNDIGGRTVTLEEKEFGVSVKFTPTVLGNGRINLKVRPEVSELNAGGVTITGVGGSAVLPSFTSRKAETTVQLMDGQSFVIGGLVKNNTTTNIKAFPFLGELPIIGLLFRSTEFQTDRSELVFVITPRLVKPLPADYRLPTDNYVPPTRKELFFDGKAEGQRPVDPAPAAAPIAVPPPPAGGGFDTRTQEKK
jgi:pilus assembly protein CpaC